jgi:hypothetical protein
MLYANTLLTNNHPMFTENGDRFVIPAVKKMKSIRGQTSWAKMMSLGGKIIALVCHPTKKEESKQSN